MYAMKLSIVIPVYNEQNTLRKLVEMVKSVDLVDVTKEIIVVNDGSFDNTSKVLKQLKKDYPDIVVVDKEKNEGKGFALRDGFEQTTGDYVIVQDADLEYDPQDYKKLLRALTEEKVDVVYGSRFSGNYKDMSTLHYLGNKFLTIATNLLYGVMLTDMETCYKLIPGDFARDTHIKSARFNFEPEITAKILKAKLKIIEVPINYQGRTHSEGKKITWKDGLSAIYTLFKFKIVN